MFGLFKKTPICRDCNHRLSVEAEGWKCAKHAKYHRDPVTGTRTIINPLPSCRDKNGAGQCKDFSEVWYDCCM